MSVCCPRFAGRTYYYLFLMAWICSLFLALNGLPVCPTYFSGHVVNTTTFVFFFSVKMTLYIISCSETNSNIFMLKQFTTASSLFSCICKFCPFCTFLLRPVSLYSLILRFSFIICCGYRLLLMTYFIICSCCFPLISRISVHSINKVS
jgi:hypothetical protein